MSSECESAEARWRGGPAPAPMPRELFKSIAVFVGWLSGSLAGVSAILYAFGYLISRAQLNLLGLQGLVSLDPDYHLQEGAKFFVVLAANYASPIFPWLYYLGWLLAGAIPIIALVGWLMSRRRKVPSQGEGGAAALAARVAAWLPRSWRELALMLLALVLLLRLTTYINAFVDALAVENILYAGPVAMESPGSAEIRGWLTSPERADLFRLKERFGELLRGEAEVALVLVLVWYLTAGRAARLWLALPFILVLSLYTLLLPMAYGVLVRPNEYAVIMVVSKSPLLANLSGELFLLRKSDTEFVVWDRASRRVLWLPKDQVAGVEARQSRPLFKD